MINLKNKKAIITGATGGIGYSILENYDHMIMKMENLILRIIHNFDLNMDNWIFMNT